MKTPKTGPRALNMTALRAHLKLLGRHHTSTIVDGLYWRYCGHLSHRHRIPCWRWYYSDGYCSLHNATCWSTCPEDAA